MPSIAPNSVLFYLCVCPAWERACVLHGVCMYSPSAHFAFAPDSNSYLRVQRTDLQIRWTGLKECVCVCVRVSVCASANTHNSAYLLFGKPMETGVIELIIIWDLHWCSDKWAVWEKCFFIFVYTFFCGNWESFSLAVVSVNLQSIRNLKICKTNHWSNEKHWCC